MANKIQIRRDTAANWTTANTVLSLGEPGYETDTKRRKTGDGTTAWTSLAYDDAALLTKWKATTAYLAGQAVLNPSGNKVTAKVDFTSGSTYSEANWNTRSTFHQPPSGNTGGISSYRVDNTGAWVSGQVVMKSTTDNANISVIDWSNVDTGTGYLLHLVAGSNMGGGLIGLGADGDTGTALVVSAKGAMTGIGLTNTSTSTGVGFAGGNFGTGLLVKLEKGSATSGNLLSLRGYAAGTAGIFKWRNAADTADLGLIEDGGQFNLYGSAGHRTRWDHGSGFDQRMYTYSGTPTTFWTTALQASSQSILFRAGQSAAHAQGSETLTTLIEVKAGARLGFFAATPVVQPARAGALTDSSGGTSGGATIAAVTDVATAANAIATLAAKYNALEAKLSAAAGGLGLTA